MTLALVLHPAGPLLATARMFSRVRVLSPTSLLSHVVHHKPPVSSGLGGVVTEGRGSGGALGSAPVSIGSAGAVLGGGVDVDPPLDPDVEDVEVEEELVPDAVAPSPVTALGAVGPGAGAARTGPAVGDAGSVVIGIAALPRAAAAGVGGPLSSDGVSLGVVCGDASTVISAPSPSRRDVALPSKLVGAATAALMTVSALRAASRWITGETCAIRRATAATADATVSAGADARPMPSFDSAKRFDSAIRGSSIRGSSIRGMPMLATSGSCGRW